MVMVVIELKIASSIKICTLIPENRVSVLIEKQQGNTIRLSIKDIEDKFKP